MLILAAALACIVFALPAEPARASGVVSGFTVTPASTQAGGNPDVSADLQFSYTGGDTVKTFTIDLPSGLFAAIGNVPAMCSSAQLDADPPACPAGSQIGTGMATVNGASENPAALYLLPPAPGQLAGWAAVISGTKVLGTGSFVVVTHGGGPPVGELTLEVPKVNGAQVTELAATVSGQTTDAKAFTRMPTSCSVATSMLSVDTYDGDAGLASDGFVPTGCGALGYSPAASAEAIRDGDGKGAELVASIAQSGAATESATKRFEVDLPPGVSFDGGAGSVAVCLGGAPCVVGTVALSSPLLAGQVRYGTVTLGGSPAAPTLTVDVPTPFALSFTGTVDPVIGTVVFADMPDVPLTALTLDITGPAGGDRVFRTGCGAGRFAVKLTPQSGGPPMISEGPLVGEACPPAPPAPPEPAPSSPAPEPVPGAPTTPSALKLSIRSGSVRVRRGRVPIALACSGGAPRAACRGTLSAQVSGVRGQGSGRGARTVTLARGRYEIGSGRSRTVVLRVTAGGLQLLARSRHGRLRVRVVAMVRGGAAVRRTVLVRG